MKYAIIACSVLQREISYLAATSDNVVTPIYLPQGLHNTPSLLKDTLAHEIEKISESDRKYDAILLGYGLCSNGVVGITAPSIPVVIPRTDDCVALLLGSQKRYLDYFNSHSGIYWYSPGWIESDAMPSEEMYNELYKTYAEQYGEDNADYLMEETNGWHTRYTYATYITSSIVDNKKYIDFTKNSADYLKWHFDSVDGDLSMLEKLISGDWNDEDFLVCPSDSTVEQSFDEGKIKISMRED